MGRTYNERRLNYVGASKATCIDDRCSDPVAGDDEESHDLYSKFNFELIELSKDLKFEKNKGHSSLQFEPELAYFCVYLT